MAKQKYGDRVRARCLELRTKGLTCEEIRGALIREKLECPSLAEVQRITAWIKPGGEVRKTPPKKQAITEEQASEAVKTLKRQLVLLEKMSEQAVEDEESSKVASITRAILATTALLARLEPPEPPNPDDDPVVIEDARKLREKLHAMVDAIVEG